MIVLTTLAHALDPEVGIHANGGFSTTNTPIPLQFGVGGELAIAPWRRLHLEIAADAGLTTESVVWLGVGPHVRYFTSAPERPVVSLFVGGGFALGANGRRGLVDGGIAVDLLKSNGARPRIQVSYGYEILSAHRVLVSLGMVFGRMAPTPPPPEVVMVEAEPLPPPRPRLTLEEGMIWLPGPVCRWLPDDEASAEIERLEMTLTQVSVMNPRSLRAPDDPGSGDTGPRPGRIAVSGGSGDVVTIDGERLLLTDGLGVADHADGRAVVRVVGGGRQLAFTVGVAEDNVTWVDAEPPAHTRVLFPSGSPRLSADAKQRIAAFVASLGDWHVELYGSYSPDGAERVNRALGQTRAEAVRDALIAAGVPADHIHIGPVQPPADGLDAVEARNATLAPVEAP